MMDIPALSMAMNQGSLEQSVSVSVLKKAMSFEENAAVSLLNTLDAAAPNVSNHVLDTYA